MIQKKLSHRGKKLHCPMLNPTARAMCLYIYRLHTLLAFGEFHYAYSNSRKIAMIKQNNAMGNLKFSFHVSLRMDMNQ